MSEPKLMNNIYLDTKGLHRGKPDGCRITGQIDTTINGRISKVHQCNRTKPHPSGYILVKPKRRSHHYRKRHRIKRTNKPVKKK